MGQIAKFIRDAKNLLAHNGIMESKTEKFVDEFGKNRVLFVYYPKKEIPGMYKKMVKLLFGYSMRVRRDVILDEQIL